MTRSGRSCGRCWTWREVIRAQRDGFVRARRDWQLGAAERCCTGGGLVPVWLSCSCTLPLPGSGLMSRAGTRACALLSLWQIVGTSPCDTYALVTVTRAEPATLLSLLCWLWCVMLQTRCARSVPRRPSMTPPLSWQHSCTR